VVLDTPSPLIVGPSEVLIDRCQRSRIPLFEFILLTITTDVILTRSIGRLYISRLAPSVRHAVGWLCY